MTEPLMKAIEQTPERRGPRPPTPEWAGELIVGDGWARFFGRVGSAQVSPCESVQVVAAVCSWIRTGIKGGPVKTVAGAIVRNHEECRIDPERPQVMILFADARLPVGAALLDEASSPLVRLSHVRAARWRRVLFGFTPETPLPALLGALPLTQRSAPHPLSVGGPSTAGIQSNWQRVAAVVRQTAEGVSLPVAARAAGFPSLGHCTRTFRQLLGLSPTLLGLVQGDARPGGG